LTNFDNAILPIAVTGKTETTFRPWVADDRVVIKNLEAVKTETVAHIKKRCRSTHSQWGEGNTRWRCCSE